MFYLSALFYPEFIINHILIFALVFITDFFDGKLARQFNATTKAGAVFDVVADVFFVIVSFTALIQNNILPFWILAVAIFKFSEFWITSFIAVRKSREMEQVFLFDTLGKTSALLLYALSLVSILAYSVLPKGIDTVFVISYSSLVTLMAAISSSHRIYLCTK